MAAAACAWILVACPAAADAASPYEPNDFPDTAFGPLEAGQTYSGVHETDNDEDYFYFYLPTRTQMQLKVTNPSSGGGYEGADLYLYRQYHSGVEYYDVRIDPRVGETESQFVTLDRGKYLIDMDPYYDGAGDKYSFQILPQGSTSDYGPIAAECAASTSATQAADAELQRLLLAESQSKGVASSLKSKVRRLKAAANRAKYRGKRNKARKLKARARGKKQVLTGVLAQVDVLKSQVDAQEQQVAASEDQQGYYCSVPE